MFTELTPRDQKHEGSSNRVFGLVFSAFFGVIAAWPILSGSPIRTWALLPCLAFLLIALIIPQSLSLLNHMWMRLGMLLHQATSPVALGIIYYTTIVPIGFLLRLTRKDLLRLKFDPSKESYWIIRHPPGPDPDSMSRQF